MNAKRHDQTKRSVRRTGSSANGISASYLSVRR